MKQIGLGLLNHHDVHGYFPPAWAEEGMENLTIHPDPGPGRRGNWILQLLPFIERTNEYHRFNLSDPNSNGGGLDSPNAQSIPNLICPSDVVPLITELYGDFEASNSYLCNQGDFIFPAGADLASLKVMDYSSGVFRYNRGTRISELLDGTSSTLLAGEFSHVDSIFDELAPADWWNGPLILQNRAYTSPCTGGTGRLLNYRVPNSVRGLDPESDEFHDALHSRIGTFSSEHAGGANFVMADGSVRFIHNSIPLTTFQALGSIAGGEVIVGD